MYIYDYVRADGDQDLQSVLAKMNAFGYELVCVSQHEHTYTIFFRRGYP